MHSDISLRRASMDDLEILFEWRNDMLTRKASHSTKEITREEHEKWLRETLHNRNRQLFIAEEIGTPVGTVRADFDPSDNSHELSWTVSPEARGRGAGKKMVALLASQMTGSIRAQIKVENTASVEIAESVGMRLEYVKDGVMHYRRPPVNHERA